MNIILSMMMMIIIIIIMNKRYDTMIESVFNMWNI
jgi:hypothetical protein